MWTYLYYSFSAKANKAVGFVVFGEEVKDIEFDVGHNVPSRLRLILAGTDNGNYPGFNGQFSRPILRVGEGAYLETHDDLDIYARKCNPPPPPDCTTLKIVKFIDKR